MPTLTVHAPITVFDYVNRTNTTLEPGEHAAEWISYVIHGQRFLQIVNTTLGGVESYWRGLSPNTVEMHE
jgi:hypothetical protein